MQVRPSNLICSQFLQRPNLLSLAFYALVRFQSSGPDKYIYIFFLSPIFSSSNLSESESKVWYFVTEVYACLFALCRPVIGLISIPNLSISKLNMLELGMPTWTDCGFLFPQKKKKKIFFHVLLSFFFSCISSLKFYFVCVCSEWAVNIQRDSYASYIGHYPLMAYFAVAENESIGRERYSFMQVLCLFPPFFHFSELINFSFQFFLPSFYYIFVVCFGLFAAIWFV